MVAILPLGGVVAAALSGPGAGIPAAELARYGVTSALLAALVGLATAVSGSLAAWLIVMYRFPGHGFFSWSLAVPLAAPGFALAYAYADMLDPAGTFRVWLRTAMGVDWPFEMRSIGGAAFVLSCAFMPYVYLAMRSAFLHQSVAALEAARMLGCTPAQAFTKVALPMARPALAAGVALAVMETLADYGAVQFLAVQTLTTGVVRSWSVFGSPAGAAQIALPLLVAAFFLLWVERRGRRGRSHDNGQVRWLHLRPERLVGGKGVLASAYCAALVGLGLVIPAAWLFSSALAQTADWARLAEAARNSVLIGTGAAALTVALALALALGTAKLPLAARLASLGYATPGAVMAIGLLAPAALVWQYAPATSSFAIAIGLLLLAYAARLMAAALEPVDAGLSRFGPSLAAASRTLGRSETNTALTVQVPLARGALFTAGLIVFVDLLKELPATLMLRPFDFDTLAVIANNYALDERLGQAGWPSLLIILLAMPAVLWLSRQVAGSRPGEAS
jgi:iron(III) transport system permease protein